MNNDINPNKKLEIYSNYLQEISGIKLTLREVDVIACILHNRGEKKIAALLEVSYRTVESHTRNIMNKLGYGSRDLIIDIIEKSGKLKYFRQYYFYLTVNAAFEKYLKKISGTINRIPVHCSIYAIDANETEYASIKSIGDHLHLANINLSIPQKNDDTSHYCKLYLLNKRNSDLIHAKANIALLCDPSLDKSTISGYEYVDFTPQEDYYLAIFELTEKIIPGQGVTKIKDEFCQEYQALKASLQEAEAVNPNPQEAPGANAPSKKIISIILSICCLFLIAAWVYNNPGTARQNYKDSTDNSPTNGTSLKLLTERYVGLSVSNLSKEGSEKNYDTIRQLNPIIEEVIAGKLLYSDLHILPPEQLTNALFNLNSIAAYFLFREYDFRKAEKLLLYSKKLAEDYLCARNKINVNFAKLSTAELYTEISMIKHLPEIYTVTVYLLGRAAIYEKNAEKASAYFSISEILGKKLKLFEGVLSARNGLGIVRFDQLKAIIGKGMYEEEQIQRNLNDLIALYRDLKHDKNSYVIDYDPAREKQKYIIPAEDIYHVIDCSKRIVKICLQLLQITKDNKQKDELLQELDRQFIGDQAAPGILVTVKTGDVLGRIASDIYNLSGNTLLQLLNAGIDFKSIKNNIARVSEVQEESDLKLIERIFILAKSNSRSNEHTKLEAYKGLAALYPIMLKQPGITRKEKDEILIKLSGARNFIGKSNR